MLNKVLLTKAYKNKEFELYLNNSNMERSKIFSLIIVLLEFCMLILTYLEPSLFEDHLLSTLRIHYFSLFAYAAIFYLFSKSYLSQKVLHGRLFKYLILITMLFGLLWGASITIIDLNSGGTMSVYLTFLFILSIVIVNRPDLSLVIYVVTHVYFLSQITSFERALELGMNSTIFLIFSWFVVRQQYNGTYKKYTNDELMKEKNVILEKQNVELARLTMLDHLTGMYNRYSMDDILSKKWLEAYINHSDLTVLMIDIDHFKVFNDTYGHIKGDECLVAVARVLNEVALDYKGYAFRYGGDEFCLLFNELAHVNILLDQIHKKIAAIDIKSKDKSLSVTLSIGVYSEVPKSSGNEWHSIERADNALYEIKSSRNRRKND